MLDKKDIEKLKKEFLKIFVTKEEFGAFKNEMSDFRNDVNNRFFGLTNAILDEGRKREQMEGRLMIKFDTLLGTMDKLVLAVDRRTQEDVMLTAKVDRHETWIHQLAEKNQMKLEH